MAVNRYDRKVKIAKHYLFTTKNYEETGKKFGVKGGTVKAYVNQCQDDDRIKIAFRKRREREERIEKKADEVLEQEMQEAVLEAKRNAIKINKEAVKMIVKLLPKETNLDRVLKAYQATNEILLPKDNEPKDVGTTNNFFMQLNQMLEKGKDNA